MKNRKLTGINIQFPISQLILEGKKNIETRTYPIPKNYVGVDLAFIETPGKNGGFKSRVVAIIRFSGCFQYESEKQFYQDTKRHCVDKKSAWAWSDEKPKWGWEIAFCELLPTPSAPPKKKGIVFTKSVLI